MSRHTPLKRLTLKATANPTPSPTTKPTPLPTTSLTQLTDPQIPKTPATLLRLLHRRLRHNPNLSHLDLQLFRRAVATDDTFRHDHTTFEYLTRSLVSTHRLSHLPSLLRFIAANPCPCSKDGIFSCPETEPIYRVAISSFCRSKMLDDALLWFDVMRKLIDGKPGVDLYNLLINAFVKAGEMGKALSFYKNMVVIDRVSPDIYTFNTLISGHCRLGKVDLALDVFKEMKERGSVPNVISFNTLIGGFFRVGNIERAVGLAREMIDLECGISRVTCEILVDGLWRKGEVLKACDLIGEFTKRDVLPSEYDCFRLVERLLSAGEVDKAFDLVVNKLWEKDFFPSLVACTTLIEGLRLKGKIEKAVILVRNMIDKGILLDGVTFCCVLEDLCRAGQVVEANELRISAAKKGLKIDGVMCRILVMGYTKEGRRKEGELLVNEMLDRGFIPDIGTYNWLMDGLFKSKC